MHKPTKTVACVVKEPPQHTQYCSVHIPKSDHGPKEGLYTEMDPLILSLATMLTLICVGSLFSSYTEVRSWAPGGPVHRDGPIDSQSYHDIDFDLCWKC